MITAPQPLFDSIAFIDTKNTYDHYNHEDIQAATTFLKSYTGSVGTFNSYRREIERLLHWSTHIAHKTLKTLNRSDVESFVTFCQNPPQSWIGTTKAPRFIEKNNQREPNPEWRPFVVTLSKAKTRTGLSPQKKDFALSSSALKQLFAILSSFYNFLAQEEYVSINPIALIRQKSKFIRKTQGYSKIRRLSELQWRYVIEAAHSSERTLFMMSAFYSMYLRISELSASSRWTPTMNDFARDNDGHWWFTTVGKGNKERRIAVSEAMLAALKRWRRHLQLSALPSPADDTPLLPRTKGKGPIRSTNYIRKIVQTTFDQAIAALMTDGLSEESEILNEATVHWLRHTGISDDVKIRPREHVRDDAGHSSSTTTDKYIDIELRDRHQSAKNKPI